MALFTDQSVITLNDLLQYETTLVQVASSHGIDVTKKIGLAMSAIANRLLLWLLNAGASDPQSCNRRELGLSTVVVTPPLQRWLCFESLAYFFNEAHNIQLNSRFQSQWLEYQRQAKNAANLAMVSGLGIVYYPLAQPAIPLATISSGTLAAQALFVQTTWTNAAGDESAPSPVNGLLLPANSTVSVAMGSAAPASATGWNVYLNSTSVGLTLRNTAPVPTGSVWSLPASGLTGVSGRPVATGNLGQSPDFYIMLSRQIQRG